VVRREPYRLCNPTFTHTAPPALHYRNGSPTRSSSVGPRNPVLVLLHARRAAQESTHESNCQHATNERTISTQNVEI